MEGEQIGIGIQYCLLKSNVVIQRSVHKNTISLNLMEIKFLLLKQEYQVKYRSHLSSLNLKEIFWISLSRLTFSQMIRRQPPKYTI